MTMEVDSTETVQETQPWNVHVLETIKEAQEGHGLRHEDYLRYRQYCARKVRRVRKALHYVNGHKSGLKSAAKYTPKPVTAEVALEQNFLLIPLFDTERCWAYAMQLKWNQSTMENDGQRARHKFHMHNKLRKALRHVNLLEQLSQALPNMTESSKLEVAAYHQWIHAQVHFECKRYAEASKCLRESQKTYGRLSSLCGDKPTMAFYAARVEEMAPQLKYCAFSLKEVEGVENMTLDTPFAMPAEDDKNAVAKTNTVVVGQETVSLTALPLNYVPLPTKPVFFDLAMNHVAFPSLQDKMEAPAPPKKVVKSVPKKEVKKPAPEKKGAAQKKKQEPKTEPQVEEPMEEGTEPAKPAASWLGSFWGK